MPAGYMEEGLASLRDFGSEFFSSPYPSTTCVEVVRVAWPDHLLEIEGMATLPGAVNTPQRHSGIGRNDDTP
jgi:hypothetical protein